MGGALKFSNLSTVKEQWGAYCCMRFDCFNVWWKCTTTPPPQKKEKQQQETVKTKKEVLMVLILPNKFKGMNEGFLVSIVGCFIYAWNTNKKLVSAISFKVKGKRNLDLFQTNMCFEI